MKKLLSILFACVMIVGMLPMVALPVSAEYVSGDFEYTVLWDGTAEISDYTGLATNVIIPSKLGGYTVTSIGDWAFSYCTSLESITIPNSATRIEYYAFYRCYSLERITIPNSVTTIYEGAFEECSSLTSITIPNSVTSIGSYAFYDTAYYNNSANWENGVLYIGNCLIEAEDLLYGTYAIQEGTSVIADNAFYDCRSLQSITIPNSVTSFGNRALAYCRSLQSITIPNNVTSIGADVFRYCTSLESITIPNSVTSIGGGAFEYCSSLKSVTIGDGVTSIEPDTFYDCTSLERITIPSSVESVWDEAFYNCESLESVTIPNSVTNISVGAFYKCNALANVYYGGTQAQWDAIGISYKNQPLTSATIHYNCSFAKITSQSATTAYASKNGIASVKVTATGDGLSYTWYIKNPGATKYSKSSVTSATYSAKMTASNSGRLAYCIVKDKYGNEVRSKTFVLRMKATITSESATAAYAKKGAAVSVKVGAVGDGLKYTWYIKNDGATKYSKSSITSSTYKATMSSTVKNRRVYCVVKDKYGKTVQSKTFILREAASIVTQPKASTTAKGAIARATVKASGDGLTYTWYIKNAGQTKFTKSSVTKSTYSTTMSNTSKNRWVYCVVKDKYGKTAKSSAVPLRMK